MVGRTPEYLGKKIEAYDVKMSRPRRARPDLQHPRVHGMGVRSAGGGLPVSNNSGPHGLSEILYAFSSAAGNNGSAFAGLTANTPWYNMTLGLAMLFGRFFMIVPVMALAGSLARKKLVPASGGSFPVWGACSSSCSSERCSSSGALTFLPALALGPVVEHFLMTRLATCCIREDERLWPAKNTFPFRPGHHRSGRRSLPSES